VPEDVIIPLHRKAATHYRKFCSEWEIAKGFIDVLIHSEPSNPKQV